MRWRLKEQRINETKNWFFEKISKTDTSSSKLKKGGKTQTNKIRNEKGDITTDTNESQRIIWEYFEIFYSNKLENLEEMDKFLGRYELPKLNQENINNVTVR
jgi:hypothetical protein